MDKKLKEKRKVAKEKTLHERRRKPPSREQKLFVYAKDMRSRIDGINSEMTEVKQRIEKIDSNVAEVDKVCKALQETIMKNHLRTEKHNDISEVESIQKCS